MERTNDGKTAVQTRWGVRVPLRDGLSLSANLYRSTLSDGPVPAIVTLTPYVAQSYHPQGLYFASQGFAFLAVDVRGRGNSDGEFRPNANEGADGYDVVEWIAAQSFCNGQVAMWGGSYAGHSQWTVAAHVPPHLTTIIPVASPFLGVDVPFRGGIFPAYLVRWLHLVSGRTSQAAVFTDDTFWANVFRRSFEDGRPFRELAEVSGLESRTFAEWLSHPCRDEYWDAHNPSPNQYAAIRIPVLTITGACDDDQLGALTHYREHLRTAPQEVRDNHFLIIGPWDHAGTRTPQREFLGLKIGPDSILDMQQLQREWYAWTMLGAAKPSFLRRRVAYYVMGTEVWRYADSLEEVTASEMVFHLASQGLPCDVFHSGSLIRAATGTGGPDAYVYDPGDISLSGLEATIDPESRVDQRLTLASRNQLIYHSAPFGTAVEIAGFFHLTAWLSIDRPDTDFRVSVYEVRSDGTVILLAKDALRARYRKSTRDENLVSSSDPLMYEFATFDFIARRVDAGSRLCLVIGPVNSIYMEKNCNTGGRVSEESPASGAPVTVRLYHNDRYQTVLRVPIGQTGDSGGDPRLSSPSRADVRK